MEDQKGDKKVCYKVRVPKVLLLITSIPISQETDMTVIRNVLWRTVPELNHEPGSRLSVTFVLGKIWVVSKWVSDAKVSNIYLINGNNHLSSVMFKKTKCSLVSTLDITICSSTELYSLKRNFCFKRKKIATLA